MAESQENDDEAAVIIVWWLGKYLWLCIITMEATGSLYRHNQSASPREKLLALRRYCAR